MTEIPQILSKTIGIGAQNPQKDGSFVELLRLHGSRKDYLHCPLTCIFMPDVSPVIKYYTAERMWCIAGAVIALASIAIAVWFLFKTKEQYTTGISYPFLVLGIIFFAICASVATRSTADLRRVTDIIQSSPPLLGNGEIPRMQKVMANFNVIIVLELVFVTSSLLVLVFASPSPLWKGVWTGLIIQSAWLLVFDLFARSRGKDYFIFLQSVLHN